jgi:hypothetical protein
MKLLALAAALGALTTAPAHAAKPACSLAAAKRAVAVANLRMQLLGDSPVRIEPRSGGTAGDVGLAVLRATRTGGWRVALARSGYKLGLFRLGGDLVGSQPIYRKNDPNCCPTGGFDHTRYHWNGKGFAVGRSWRTRSFGP